MEQQLDRIATAFERIAHTLESIEKNGLTVNLDGGIDTNLDGAVSVNLNDPMVVLATAQRALKVELSNCTDYETPFEIQIHD